MPASMGGLVDANDLTCTFPKSRNSSTLPCILYSEYLFVFKLPRESVIG